ncbi:WASH complex subunit FAM21 [Trichoplax sp. H2]|nr:WASH complex subunit FAM21 [Trichoplax sp. H2]|eukprot:RDD41765.1 WASH complex subunit FAM21 [Trichoplax sp. H2]
MAEVVLAESNGTDQLPNGGQNEASGQDRQVTADGRLVGRQYDLNDIRKNSNKWSADADLGLLNYLREVSQRLVSRTHQVENLVKDVIQNVKGVDCQVNNVMNEFLMLSNDHFIENRVYDDELRPHEVDPKQANEANQEDKNREVDAIPCIKEALKDGLTLLNEAYDLVETTVDNTISDSDSDGEADRSLPAGFNEPVLEPKDKYVDRPLPVIIGTAEFLQRDDVGLLDEEDQAEEEATDVGSISSSSSSESENEESDKEAEENSEIDKSDDDRPRQRQPQRRTFTSSEEDDEDDLFAAPKKVTKRSDVESDESEDMPETDQVQETKPNTGIAAELNKRLQRNTVDSDSDGTEAISEAVASDTSSIKISRKTSKTSSQKVVDDDLFQTNDDEDGPFGSKGGLFNARKSGLFDDDGGLFDDDTKQDVKQDIEQDTVQKVKEKRNRTKSGRKIPAGAVAVFGSEDSGLFGTPTEESIAKEKPNDDDIKNTPTKEASKPNIKTQKSVSKGLFDDDEDEDELFGAAPVSIKKPQLTKKMPPTSSLFADDDDDDAADDLFATAAATTQPTRTANDRKKNSSKKKALVGGVALPSASSIKSKVHRPPSSGNESEEDNPLQANNLPKTNNTNSSNDTVGIDVAAAATVAAVDSNNQSKVTKKSGLFDSDTDDNNLFLADTDSKTSGNTSKSEEKTAKKKPVGGVALFGASAIKSRRPPDSEDDDDEEDDFSQKGNPPPLKISQPSKAKSNLGDLFDEDDDDDYGLFNSSTKPSIVESPAKNAGNDVKLTNANQSKSSTDSKKSRTAHKDASLFDDEEDDGLFSTTTPKPQPTTNKPVHKVAANPGLFDDNETEDDLFLITSSVEKKSDKSKIAKKVTNESSSVSLSKSEDKASKDDKAESSTASPIKPKKLPAGAKPIFGAAGIDIFQKKKTSDDKGDSNEQKLQKSNVASPTLDEKNVSESVVVSLDNPPTVKTLESVNKGRTKGQARRRPPSRRGVSSKSSSSSLSTPISEKLNDDVFDASNTVAVKQAGDSSTGDSISVEAKPSTNQKTASENKSSSIFNSSDWQDDDEDDLFASPAKINKSVKSTVEVVTAESAVSNSSLNKNQKITPSSTKKSQLFGDSTDDEENLGLFTPAKALDGSSKSSASTSIPDSSLHSASLSKNIATTDSPASAQTKKGRSDSGIRQPRVSSLFDNDDNDNDDIFGGFDKKKSLKGKVAAKDTVSQEPPKKDITASAEPKKTDSEIVDNPLLASDNVVPDRVNSSSASDLLNDSNGRNSGEKISKDIEKVAEESIPPVQDKAMKKSITADNQTSTEESLEKQDKISADKPKDSLPSKVSESSTATSNSDIKNVSMSAKEGLEVKSKAVKQTSQPSSIFDHDDDIFGDFKRNKASKTKEVTKTSKKNERDVANSPGEPNTAENAPDEVRSIDAIDKQQFVVDSNPVVASSADEVHTQSAAKTTSKLETPSSIFDDDSDIFGDFEKKKASIGKTKASKVGNRPLTGGDNASSTNTSVEYNNSEKVISGGQSDQASSEKKSKSKPSDDIFADDLGIFGTPGTSKKSKKKSDISNQKGAEETPKAKSSIAKKKGSKKADKKPAKKYDIFDNDGTFDDPLNAGGN